MMYISREVLKFLFSFFCSLNYTKWRHCCGTGTNFGLALYQNMLYWWCSLTSSITMCTILCHSFWTINAFEWRIWSCLYFMLSFQWTSLNDSKYNINSFVGQYSKYFVLNKRIDLNAFGQYFLFPAKYFSVLTGKRVNIL